MSANDISRCRQLCKQPLTELPKVFSNVVVERKKGALEVIFVPLVFRDGKYQKLVSFKLNVKGSVKAQARTRADDSLSVHSGRYAEHSVLQNGIWAKIRIPASGIYQISGSFARSCGFQDISQVKVYGYGGGLQPESLTEEYLIATGGEYYKTNDQ